jgi:hypothetical protein
MTTAYTSLLGLALPVTGELSGTWGDTVNQSITSLLDSAIAGTTTLSTDADVTLTTTSGAANTAREAILLCSGARTVLRTITAPAQSKIYTIINATTGGFSVKIVGAGPTAGVTIIAGESAVVAWNGSDFIKISTSGGAGVFSSITNTGLTSGRVVYSTTGGLETDSANLTFNGTTLTANTLNLTNALTTAYGGTGLTSYTAGDLPYYAAGTVLSKLAIGTAGQILTVNSGATAPQWSTLSGVAVTTFSAGTTGFTPNSATSGAVTLGGTLATTNGGTGLTSFTANGVVYASSTSALATGSALTFDGTNFGVGGAAIYRIHGINNADAFGIVGMFENTSTGSSAQAATRVKAGTNTLTFGMNGSGVSGASAYIGADQATPLLFYTGNSYQYWQINGSEQMRLTSTGLGIGTSSPGYKLDVNGTAAFAGATTLNGGANTLKNTGELQWKDSGGTAQNVLFMFSDNNVYLSSPVTGASLIFRGVGFAERARIDTAGNLGLGVTPSVWSQGKAFEISAVGEGLWGNGAGDIWFVNNAYFNGGWKFAAGSGTAKATAYRQGAGLTSGTHTWSIAGSGTAGGALTFTDAMTLDASGNFIVGGTSTPNYKLCSYTASGNNGITIGNGSNTGSDFAVLDFNQASGQRAVLYTNNNNLTLNVNGGALIMQTGSTERARIDSAGNLGLGVTPSAWGSGYKALQIGSQLCLYNTGGYNAFGANFYVDSSGNPRYLQTDYATIYQQNRGAGIHAWFIAPSGTAGAAITFTQAMTLDASGNLLVGKTALDITTVGAQLRPGGQITSTLAGSTSGTDTLNVYSTGAGDYRFYVDMAGTIHATSIVITAISDERLKENVRDIDTGLNAIMALKPRRFDWKEGKGQDKKNAAGFIAQEFETVFPECVGTSKAGEDGIEYKNINHETLIPTLVKAMQEQQALIESLTKRLAAAGI